MTLLDKAVFTIFDFETTGLYPYSGDTICEIGAIRMAPGKRMKRFHSLIDPGRPLSEGAFSVNGITEEMLKGKPKIDQILPDFLKFIKGTVLVAYNAGFDLGFLEAALGPGKEVLNDYRVIDALRIARRLFPEIGKYNLASVSEALEIPHSGEHRAMADCLMTMKVFEKELDALKKEGVKTVEELAYAGTRKISAPRVVKDYKYKLIEEAIREQKKLNIKYRSVWHDTVTKRTITPKEIRSGYDKTYVIAHCHLKNGERNFRLDGMLEVEPEITG